MRQQSADPPRAQGPTSAPAEPYRVLARVYRPQRLSELIGQEVLVRSLTNAIDSGRIAHAFLLTGIRGVGKTTTARIIARALNCVGAEGNGGPTPEPCGTCTHCQAIAEDRHIDVLEMDAATRTGIDDIREIVDSVRYAPTSARFKVYIIDEVHMLSEKAFNGLLKTLEEPPAQAKFVFATTEVRKVPVTILSRCQRFDLRRIEVERLQAHLETIAERERIPVAAEALSLLVRAAEGSVRDALSLLDQAIALAGSEGRNRIEAEQVRDMLGLADRSRVIGLFERLMRGDVPGSLETLGELHALGCEPEGVIGDLLEICHWLTRLKVAPEAPAALGVLDADAERGQAMAAALTLPVLARSWQMLLKGLDELRLAPDTLRAAEMLLVRIAYAADLPPPGALTERLSATPSAAPAAVGGGAAAAGRPSRRASTNGAAPPPDAGDAVAALSPAADLAETIAPAPDSFEAVVALFAERDQPMLYSWLHDQCGLVTFAPGRLELHADGQAPADWPRRTADCLSRWTGRPWHVSMSERPGVPSLGEQAAARKRARIEGLADDPRVRPVLEGFPGARISDVRAAGRMGRPVDR